MNLSLALDLREQDFNVMDELVAIVSHELEHLTECHPLLVVSRVVISEHQLKMLRFERYLAGEPLHIVKQSGPVSVCDVPVMVELERGSRLAGLC